MSSSFNLFSRRKVIVTHNQSFHADDVSAVALLDVLFDGKIEVIRTRDPKFFEKADFVLDVGQKYDGHKFFDHHQKEGAGIRPNSVPYATVGLVWKHFGRDIIKKLFFGGKASKVIVAPETIENIFHGFDRDYVVNIDAGDNGIKLFNYKDEFHLFDISRLLSEINPGWKDAKKPEDYQRRFLQAVQLSKEIMLRTLRKLVDQQEVDALVLEDYRRAEDKRLVYLSGDYPDYSILSKYPEPLFIIEKRDDGTWVLGTIKISREGFRRRRYLPPSWAGLSDHDLQKVTGVHDAIFCHRGLIIAVAGSKEGIESLAEIALSQ